MEISTCSGHKNGVCGGLVTGNTAGTAFDGILFLECHPNASFAIHPFSPFTDHTDYSG